MLSRFNQILTEIDRILGELGIVKVVQFVISVIEVFCKFFDFNLLDSNKISVISKTIQDMIGGVSNAFSAVFGNHVPQFKRNKKWGLLAITDQIKTQTSKFENHSAIVERTCSSFEKFFGHVERIDNHSQTKPLLCQSEGDAGSVLDQVNIVGEFFQQLEVILSYGVLIFSNEEKVLNPILDQVDEGSKILDKYFNLHIVYKILLGANYLSQLKGLIKKIFALLETSNLKINSPEDFVNEVKDRYPNLLYLICEKLTDDLKNKLNVLPAPISNALDGAVNGAISKMKFF